MADDRVEVVFGAQVDDLVAGVQQVRDQIASLAPSAQQTSASFRDVAGELETALPAGSRAAAEEWQKSLDVIDRSLDTMLKGVLTGTQSWQQAMDRLFSNLAVSFIEAIMKMMVQWAAFEALTQAFGIGAAGSPVANPFAVGAGGIGGVIGQIGSGIGGILGLADGAWSVPQDMLAVVHAGEMVVPADIAAMARSGGLPSFASGTAAPAGTGVTLNVSVQAMDAAGVAQWANSNAKTLAATISRYLSANPSARGDF